VTPLANPDADALFVAEPEVIGRPSSPSVPGRPNTCTAVLCGLLAREAQSCEPDEHTGIARLTVELLRPISLAPSPSRRGLSGRPQSADHRGDRPSGRHRGGDSQGTAYPSWARRPSGRRPERGPPFALPEGCLVMEAPGVRGHSPVKARNCVSSGVPSSLPGRPWSGCAFGPVVLGEVPHRSNAWRLPPTSETV